MKQRLRTPGELVEALQQRDESARGRLWEAVRAPLERLMGELIVRHRLEQDSDRLTLHALHLAETWIRTRPPREFDRLSWDAFRNAVLLHVARLSLSPFGVGAGQEQASRERERPEAGAPAPLPACNLYHNETLFLPYERVGGFWFGGDWYGGRKAADDALWVIVADVTGHGYYAYLLASVLPHVWEACWKDAPPGMRPADLLQGMHDLLESCLPEGVYVECTLVRLDAAGQATAAPAGGSRLLLRRQGGASDLLKLRGGWLGLFPPSPADEKSWTLAEGDELLLGTDGAFDHLPATVGGQSGSASANLMEDIRRLLREALHHGPQKDDITLVLLRRRLAAERPVDSTPALRKGADDVSV
jgi:serine phosphatase RsbU (regulator of sigma subunit)